MNEWGQVKPSPASTSDASSFSPSDPFSTLSFPRENSADFPRADLRLLDQLRLQPSARHVVELAQYDRLRPHTHHLKLAWRSRVSLVCLVLAPAASLFLVLWFLLLQLGHLARTNHAVPYAELIVLISGIGLMFYLRRQIEGMAPLSNHAPPPYRQLLRIEYLLLTMSLAAYAVFVGALLGLALLAELLYVIDSIGLIGLCVVVIAIGVAALVFFEYSPAILALAAVAILGTGLQFAFGFVREIEFSIDDILPGWGWPLIGLMVLGAVAGGWLWFRLWSWPQSLFSRMSGNLRRSYDLLQSNRRVDAAVVQTAKTLLDHNRRLAGADPWQTVCAQCLARFQPRTVDFRNLPRSSFACCLVCGSDLNPFQNVHTLSLRLDARMSGLVTLSDGTAIINGLLWLKSGRPGHLPQFDEFVIREASDYDIEALITLYNSVTGNPSGQTPLAQLPCRIEPPASPGTNILRVLQTTFQSVESDGHLPSSG